MVVNGSCEQDWPQVVSLARAHPLVLPSLGCHPWYAQERSSDWEKSLMDWLDRIPESGVGEIGLDRWKPGLDYAGQEEVFLRQLHLAAERDRPVSIHCLRAWGRLHELLRHNPRPRRGFLLHSYGGPREMIAPFAKLGAYFGFPGYFLHERKTPQRETFKQVPPDRLLVETDAPDQLLPQNRSAHPLTGPEDQPINHPANLRAVYLGLAQTLGEAPESLAVLIEQNFWRLFDRRSIDSAPCAASQDVS